jgi:hypothetical protein
LPGHLSPDSQPSHLTQKDSSIAPDDAAVLPKAQDDNSMLEASSEKKTTTSRPHSKHHTAAAQAQIEETAGPNSDTKTITLSYYVFGLLALGCCIVGSVLSFLCGKFCCTGKRE